jgi:hypothetical protein
MLFDILCSGEEQMKISHEYDISSSSVGMEGFGSGLQDVYCIKQTYNINFRQV